MEIVVASNLGEISFFSISLLVAHANHEFYPPLSSRSSILDKKFEFKPDPFGKDDFRPYLNSMRDEKFVLAIDDYDDIIGFIAFIPEHPTFIDGGVGKALYVTTVIVDPAYRGSGVIDVMYECLFDYVENSCDAPNEIVFTTWESDDPEKSNIAHMKVADRLGFTRIKTLKDDRGPGVNTVYFSKKF